MKNKADVIAHVSEATGMAFDDVEKVLDAAFGFVRESALTAGGFGHPALGRVVGVERKAGDGKTRMVYRYRPHAADPGGGPGGRRGGGKGKRGGKGRPAASSEAGGAD